MTLKELTADLHQEAESTKFMKAVFAKTLPPEIWLDWTYQKTLFYGTIENAAGALGLLRDLPDIARAFYIYQDYEDMKPKGAFNSYNSAVKDYNDYLLSINKDHDKILAHVYTWHMGDLYGGQMIKKILPGKHYSLAFKDHALLIANLRLKLSDRLAPEAREAFTWAIRMMKTYDNSLE